MSVFIIAEIGINHNGDISLAKQLIDLAKKVGCDAVKFQKRTIDVVYQKDFLDMLRESPWGTTQRHQKEGLEFGKKEFDQIDDYCREKNIPWFASAWDIESQMFLSQYSLKHNKVASAMVTNLPLLKVIAEEKKPTFIATGMSTFNDIDRAVDIFLKQGCSFTLMHCVSTYPSEDAEANLLVMKSLKKRYLCDVGYSGHEKGTLPSILAAAFGAVAVERHITLDKTMYGSDQAASLEYDELEQLVSSIRRVPQIIGDGIKKVSEREAKVANSLRYFKE
jgi:N-acetylneuraminate synthase